MGKASKGLVKVVMLHEENERGEMAYTVTPYYRLECGRVVSVPDTRGWATRAEADNEVRRLASK